MGKEREALSKYITPEVQDRIVTALQQMQNAAHANSADHGFWEKDEDIALALMAAGRPDLVSHHWNNVKAAKIALMHSELSEALEGIRAGDGPSDKLHEHGITQVEEEFADNFIRNLDYAGKFLKGFPRAVLLKMGYNVGREKLHGKKL